MGDIRVIAFYLPQFHPTEINDKYWGKGFTEWTNVAKAKPLYKGHYQPQIPSDLGFYDLRIPEIRDAQASLAKEAGIEGFCYWNYWFGKGKKVLEMPIEELIRTGKPDFPFCIGWANHDWSNKTWSKEQRRVQEDTIFLKQEYLGEEDYKDYFNYLLPMFKDKRYITIDDKPLFYVFEPENIPDNNVLISTFRQMAIENGLPGIFFVARADSIGKMKIRNEKNYLDDRAAKRFHDLLSAGYDAVNSYSFRRAEIMTNGTMNRAYRKIKGKLLGTCLMDYDYEKIVSNLYMKEDYEENVFPTICPRKDRTPRSGKNAWLYKNSSPEKFQHCVEIVMDYLRNKPGERKIVFLDSWNEWGEGAYMEPDIIFQHQYLDALKHVIEQERKF